MNTVKKETRNNKKPVTCRKIKALKEKMLDRKNGLGILMKQYY